MKITNYKDLFEALLAGKKLAHNEWNNGLYFKLIEGELVDQKGEHYDLDFSSDYPSDMRIYEEERKEITYIHGSYADINNMTKQNECSVDVSLLNSIHLQLSNVNVCLSKILFSLEDLKKD